MESSAHGFLGVLFSVHDLTLVLPVERVREIAPRVLFSPLPGAPRGVLGAFEHRGELAVAVDVRTRLGRPERRPSLDDHVLVARSARRLLGLLVDRAENAVELRAADVVPPPVPLQGFGGVLVRDDGIVLVQDLDAFLSLDEERALDEALAAHA